jgi:cytochrome b
VKFVGITQETASAAGVKVWDPFLRTFHWLLAALFALAWYTGGIWDDPHLVAGYALAVIVVTRIVWGFVGPRYARFRDFVYRPQAIVRFLADTVRMRAPRYIGHNPAGGAMVIALLLSLIVVCITGIMMTTEAFWGVAWVDNLHMLSSNFCLILVGLHVTGVIIASIEHKENLVIAMITGWKRML